MGNLLHIGGQSVCIRAGINGSPAQASTPLAVDFIIRLERVHDDMQALLAEINRRRDPKLPPYPFVQGVLQNVRNISHLKISPLNVGSGISGNRAGFT